MLHHPVTVKPRLHDYNRFVNRLYRVNKHPTGCQTGLTTGSLNVRIHDTAGCQTGLYNRFDNRVTRFDNRVERTAAVHSTGSQNGLYIRFDKHGLTTLLNEHTVRSTGCQTGLYNWFDNWLYTRYSCLSNRLSNGFDNQLDVCIHNTTGCQNGLTTGCIV